MAGHWNTAIFSPKWVGDIFNAMFSSTQIEVEFLADAAGAQARYSNSLLRLMPDSKRLIVAPQVTDEETLQRAEDFAIAVLEKLPHTPINAFGVNYGFFEDAPNRFLANLFRLNDFNRISDNEEYLPISVSIERAFRLNQSILNVALTQSQETQRININLNFHHDVTGASEATNKLKGSVVKYKNQGLNLLESVYELVLEGK